MVEQFCQAIGQLLLPIVRLLESASQVVKNVIHEIQIHALETIFSLSAEQIAGARTPGKAQWGDPLARAAGGQDQAGRPQSRLLSRVIGSDCRRSQGGWNVRARQMR